MNGLSSHQTYMKNKPNKLIKEYLTNLDKIMALTIKRIARELMGSQVNLPGNAYQATLVNESHKC